jgi:molybdenum cofactor biosynthesis protein B
MSQSAAEHRTQAPTTLRCAVVTVSDTRTLETDTGGAAVIEHLTGAGHVAAARHIVPDEPRLMRALLTELVARADVDVILLTGGTGLSRRDQTYETVRLMFTKEIPGYGELFRWLSYQEVGAAAMLSRAVGGLIGPKVVLTMPGSPAGVRLAMEKIIVPELGHLIREAGK